MKIIANTFLGKVSQTIVFCLLFSISSAYAAAKMPSFSLPMPSVALQSTAPTLQERPYS